MTPALPLSVPGLVAAAVLVYVVLALPRPGWRVARWLVLGLGLALGLRLVAANTGPPLGLLATYWARATPDGPIEHSTDFRGLTDATRIEPRLDLRGEEFGVHFFNDAARFNFGPDVQPARDQLLFAVRYQGFLMAPADGERRFVIESTGPAQLTVDGATWSEPDKRVFLTAGLHQIGVTYSRPEARVPFLRVSWDRTPGGPLEPIGGADVRWQANAGGADLSSVLTLISIAGLVVVLASWLFTGLSMVRDRAAVWRAGLGAVPLVFLLHGLLLQAPLAGRATILSGLDDWLIYESSARDILLNGLWMDGGQGHAPPFYGQPLYPYVLAFAHALTGEGLLGPLALQFAALGLVLVGTAVLARRAFGARLDGLVALAGLWLLLQLEGEHFKVARQLFNENLYMPLVLASLIALVTLARRGEPPTWWRALLVGGLLGLTAITRSQFLLFVPFALLILSIKWRWRAGLPVLAVLAGVLIAIAPVTARNVIVSGELVPISTSAGASLLEFHRPPPGLIDPAALQRDPLYEALHLDAQTRTVVAFIRADPLGYGRTLLPPAAHSVGLQGRNDPGVYWPLLVTSLLYVASFALSRTRRLHVWPIHAFVAAHLLVLMLFEADTYGYRLVMPMYAPMVAVAAQVPLAALRAIIRARRSLNATSAERATRFAAAGWGLIAGLALVLQARSLVEIWPQRDAALHGLGGPAAHAAATVDRVGADAIYVASIDGTPRRFGAGTLPGLRYPWFKWFDPTRSLPLPAGPSTAVYMLSELTGQTVAGDLVACLGQPDASAERVLSGAEARQLCQAPQSANAAAGLTFDGVARIEALRVPDTGEAGQALEARLLWQPLVSRPEPQQFSVQLDDPDAGDGPLAGNGTLELYPANQWQPGESLLSRLPVATDATAIPQRYRLTLGIGSTRANAPPATALVNGARTDRAPVGFVTLAPGVSAADQPLPADMRHLEGPPLTGGGLELIGARPLPAEAAIGGPLKVGLLWRAMYDGPEATQLTMRLVRSNGEVVQETQVPLLGGRLSPSVLRGGSVVRDEQTLVISTRAPTETLAVDLDGITGRVRLGTVKLTGREHVFDDGSAGSNAPALATFGESMQLLTASFIPTDARANDKITVKLRWRSTGEMQQAYKIFVHVLDPTGERVAAQRDAEPQDGRAPTTAWVRDEIIDDEYTFSLPAALPAGDYPVEIGVYEARSGDRLRLGDGDNRLVLSTRLRVRQ